MDRPWEGLGLGLGLGFDDRRRNSARCFRISKREAAGEGDCDESVGGGGGLSGMRRGGGVGDRRRSLMSLKREELGDLGDWGLSSISGLGLGFGSGKGGVGEEEEEEKGRREVRVRVWGLNLSLRGRGAMEKLGFWVWGLGRGFRVLMAREEMVGFWGRSELFAVKFGEGNNTFFIFALVVCVPFTYR